MKRLTDEEIEQAERVLSGSLTCSGDAYSRLVSDVLSRALDELKMWRAGETHTGKEVLRFEDQAFADFVAWVDGRKP